ncbi:hypothetical protein [Thaumasiovibrio subtropicus]|uniref:hypothetical protein n=1 Tax=Thaumasiovibrio subtropicus TaxID=1891207 RepID=UPI000B34EA98|nr:hypothetical protein [Thaumasiovibrio subtropicus]
MDKDSTLLQHVAPNLSAALEGPFSEVAERSLYDSLDVDYRQDGAEEALHHKITDPNSLPKIRELEHNFKQEMKNLGIDTRRLSSFQAQRTERQFQRPQFILSAVFLIAYFILLAAILAIEVSDSLNMIVSENSLMGQIQVLFGVLTAGVGQILSYWFGGIMKKSES